MIELIGTILGTILGGSLLKAKPYCLWIRGTAGGPFWVCSNPAGNSARRCKKARHELVAQGIPEERILILAKGINPPKEI